MILSDFVKRLKENPESVSFNDTIEVITGLYEFTPTGFKNGTIYNAAGENSGSCKVFSFAKIQGLSKEETLSCFGSYYAKDVLGNPEGKDHQNIRNFMKTGWEGIEFDQEALSPK